MNFKQSQVEKKISARNSTRLTLEPNAKPIAMIAKPNLQMNSPKSPVNQNQTPKFASLNVERPGLQNRNQYLDYRPDNRITQTSETRSQITTKGSLSPIFDQKANLFAKKKEIDSRLLITNGQNKIYSITKKPGNFSTSQIKHRKGPLKQILETSYQDKYLKTEPPELGLDSFKLNLVDLNCSMSNEDDCRTTSLIITARDDNQFFSSVLTQDKKSLYKNQQTQNQSEDTFGLDEISEHELALPKTIYVFISHSSIGRF